MVVLSDPRAVQQQLIDFAGTERITGDHPVEQLRTFPESFFRVLLLFVVFELFQPVINVLRMIHCSSPASIGVIPGGVGFPGLSTTSRRVPLHVLAQTRKVLLGINVCDRVDGIDRSLML